MKRIVFAFLAGLVVGWSRRLLDEYEEATNAAMNYGDGFAEGQRQMKADWYVAPLNDVTAEFMDGTGKVWAMRGEMIPPVFEPSEETRP